MRNEAISTRCLLHHLNCQNFQLISSNCSIENHIIICEAAFSVAVTAMERFVYFAHAFLVALHDHSDHYVTMSVYHIFLLASNIIINNNNCDTN